MKQFFIGESFMQLHHHCVMIDAPDRGVLHFIATKKELDNYTKMNGGTVSYRTGLSFDPTDGTTTEHRGLT